mmetsp:Transcript_28210/g.65226  ORF Transcript_28210/g.65226 Transcript_28210/m.65226 type:complete len:322 (-) Transcript_28210:8-973(-)
MVFVLAWRCDHKSQRQLSLDNVARHDRWGSKRLSARPHGAMALLLVAGTMLAVPAATLSFVTVPVCRLHQSATHKSLRASNQIGRHLHLARSSTITDADGVVYASFRAGSPVHVEVEADRISNTTAEPNLKTYIGAIKSLSLLNDGDGYGFIACSRISRELKHDVFIGRADVEALVNNSLVKGTVVSFKMQLNKKGLPQARGIERFDGIGPSHTFSGRIQSFSQSEGYGFIHCNEAASFFDSDIFLHKNQLGELMAGERVKFSIELSERGQPQARNVTRATASPSSEAGNMAWAQEEMDLDTLGEVEPQLRALDEAPQGFA